MDLHSDEGDGSSIEEDIRDGSNPHKANDTRRYTQTKREINIYEFLLLTIVFFIEVTACLKKSKNLKLETRSII